MEGWGDHGDVIPEQWVLSGVNERMAMSRADEGHGGCMCC